MRGKIGAFVVVLALALMLAACGGKKAPGPAQEEAAAPAGQEESLCLYLFWSRAPESAQELLALVAKGRKFPLAARQIMEPLPPEAARLNATCMSPSELDPLLAQQAQSLEIGQVSPLFDYQDGAALLMRTTDQFWKQGAEFYQQGQYPQAEASLRRHLELHPDAATVWQALSEALAAQDKNDQALEALDRALTYSPESPALLNDRATQLMRLGRREEAVEAYGQALALAPGSPLLMHNLAWALLQQGQELARAQELASQAVRLDPRQARFWDTLGQVQKARGDYAKAVISLHRAHYLGAQNQGNQQDITAALLKLPPEVVARLSQERQPPAPAKPATPDAKAEAMKTTALARPQSADPMGAGAAPLTPAPRREPQAVPAAPAKPQEAARPASPAPAPADAAALPAPEPFVPGYYILVGSFRTSELAADEMRRWRRRNQAVWMEWNQVRGKGDWVRVMLGPYQKRDDAVQDARSFRRQGFIKSYRVLEK